MYFSEKTSFDKNELQQRFKEFTRSCKDGIMSRDQWIREARLFYSLDSELYYHICNNNLKYPGPLPEFWVEWGKGTRRDLPHHHCICQDVRTFWRIVHSYRGLILMNPQVKGVGEAIMNHDRYTLHTSNHTWDNYIYIYILDVNEICPSKLRAASVVGDKDKAR